MPNISEYPRPMRFVRRISRDDFPSIRLAGAQGMLLWQPVKYGRCSQTWGAVTITLCFGIRNLTTIFIRHVGRFQIDWKIAILILAEQSVIISVHHVEIW